MFFSNVLGHPGLHPNKSKASSLDIAHGYWVAYVNICWQRIWIFYSIQRYICHLFCILYDIMLDFYTPYENCCREVMPQCFLFEWKSASEKFGREVAPPRFHFQSKSASHAEVMPLHFFFQTDFRFPSHQRRGGGCQSCVIGGRKYSHVSHVSLACFSRFARMLLPFVGWKHMGFLLRPNVARPSSPSIARKWKICPKIEVRWCHLSVRRGFWLKMETRWRDLPAKLFTRGFSFKKETLWRDLPAKFYECGASSQKEGGGNGNSCYISIEQWEIHVKSWIK